MSLNSLEIGKYSFEVFSGVNKKVKKTGRFEILATDIEDVFNINKTKELKELSTVNQGVYMGLEGFSIAIEKHLKTQKHSIIKNKVIHSKSLIDRKYLVMFILLTLSVEWFLRKYHGKI
ncbi:MAG: hypothetical protein HRT66_00205 [Flavobacteriaceae bacterium]|nr:hypothetical protein [Flavobacteriaceae bacterium]